MILKWLMTALTAEHWTVASLLAEARVQCGEVAWFRRRSAFFSGGAAGIRRTNAVYDIRIIQQMLGHSSEKPTMIYTHTVPSKTLKEQKSPLDLVCTESEQ